MRYIFKSKTGEVTHEITSSKPLKRREIKKQLKLSDKIAKAEAKSARYEEKKRKKEIRRSESARGRAKERRRIYKEVKKNLPYYRERREKEERRRKKRARRREAFLDAYRSARRKGGYSYGTRKKRRSKSRSGLSLGGYNF